MFRLGRADAGSGADQRRRFHGAHDGRRHVDGVVVVSVAFPSIVGVIKRRITVVVSVAFSSVVGVIKRRIAVFIIAITRAWVTKRWR